MTKSRFRKMEAVWDLARTLVMKKNTSSCIWLQKHIAQKSGMVVYTFNPITWEEEAGRSL